MMLHPFIPLLLGLLILSFFFTPATSVLLEAAGNIQLISICKLSGGALLYRTEPETPGARAKARKKSF